MRAEPVEDAVTSDRDHELGVIAAAHAALHPARRAQRADILAESVVQVLRHQPLPEEHILQELQRLWKTTSITRPLVRSALADAQAANLVMKQATLTGTDWVATPEGLRDTQEDAQWAEGVLERFDAEVRGRLDEDTTREILTEAQVALIVTKLREAIAVGAQGLYALEIASSPGTLRPIHFNDRAAFEHLKSLEPKIPRQAASRLLIAAINPEDPFADELVHVLVTANVLHGMVTRRDVTQRPNLAGVRIAVDTSVLVDLPAQGSPAAVAVEEAFRLSQALGAEVVVADHTIDEWQRLFDGADAEMKAHGLSTELGPLATLLDNPFTRAFNVLRASDPTLSWGRFQSTWSDPTAELRRLGVNVRPNGNHTDADKQAVATVRKTLGRANRERAEREPFARRLRTACALDADAQSAGMVARWRRNKGSQSAYFLAHDRMTGRAYAEAFPNDKVPLSITLTAWVTLAAALSTDDPARQAACADIVANAALRESFLALAVGYTYAEVVELAKALADDPGPASPSDVSEFVQQTFDDMEAEIAVGDCPEAMRLRGSRLLASRTARRNQRARRAEETAQRRLERVREEERARGAAEVSAVLQVEADHRVALQQKLAERDAAMAAERVAADLRVTRQKRVTLAVGLALISVAAAVILGMAGALTSTPRWTVLIGSLLLVGCFCVAYVTKPAMTWWQVVGTGLVAAIINVLTGMPSRLR